MRPFGLYTCKLHSLSNKRTASEGHNQLLCPIKMEIFWPRSVKVPMLTQWLQSAFCFANRSFKYQYHEQIFFLLPNAHGGLWDVMAGQANLSLANCHMRWMHLHNAHDQTIPTSELVNISSEGINFF